MWSIRVRRKLKMEEWCVFVNREPHTLEKSGSASYFLHGGKPVGTLVKAGSVEFVLADQYKLSPRISFFKTRLYGKIFCKSKRRRLGGH